MPSFQTFLPFRTLRSKIAFATLLWLALISGLSLSLPAPTAAQTINFEPPVYLHPDLNGNTVMASNSAGQIIWQERLEPYGKKTLLSNTAAGGSADQGFHGKNRDEETGLIYFGARHYHPLLGRFLSMDPVEAQSENLHSFNRYAFANNNPYKYTDPDGQIPIPIILYYGVTTLTPIVSGLAVRFAASRAVQFGMTVAAGEVGLAVPGAVAVGAGAAAKGGGLIYRAASGTPASMTPRAVDTKGLSAANSLENALPSKNQVIDTSKLKNLCAVCDNDKTGHVSIMPKDASQMQGWINSRGGNEVHPLTKELMDAVVDTVRK